MPATITRRARAKLNLALHVTGRRDDGYHTIETLVVFADFGDTITVKPAVQDGFETDGPYSARVPGGPDNLVLKARDALRAAADAPTPPASIRLEKTLPPASGVGGGSSDAAATLIALDQLWGLHMGERDLAAVGQALGADVPMCLAGHPLVAKGIGEIIEPVAGLPALALVLVNPGVEVATPAVFAALGRRDNAPLPRLPSVADNNILVDWLAASTRNDLEAPARAIAPQIDDVLDALAAAGARFARMSGSGATCYGVFPAVRDAGIAAETIRRNNPGWFVTATTTLASGD